ncbi:MAG TPA: phytoene/squalene synthase family protein [Chthonomonas sp.]|uniref:phytoene/squalene synthase family protein n=1 Tax=Chthonomonas sp. TaxID=2282153 RepID=UPI002B4AE242|nr:phytoene/squalene synthase family protein [Chthonomonas sp.]HLI47717.1 phytoene/squalene synthase family protein [Chthonomonas sp.]
MPQSDRTSYRSREDRLKASYRYCERIARSQARNFYYSFVALPPAQRAAMCAVYAFMRYSDDVSDEAAITDRFAAIQAWRAALDRALEGDYGDSLILPAFHDTVCRYQIPVQFFYELIEGTAMDLTHARYATWDDLYLYCYRVASVVGFVCLYIWGFDAAEGKALRYAEACGIAFQLTNILRDIGEDYDRGRIYLPQEDMRRFCVSEADIEKRSLSDAFQALMRFEVERARHYYTEAKKLLPFLSKEAQPTFAIMYRIYRGILDEIERNNYDVFSHRARVSTLKKVQYVLEAWVRQHRALELEEKE